jgi:hypothetical protein
LSPEYDAVIVSVPAGRAEVVQVTVAGRLVTGLELQPVFVLHVTEPPVGLRGCVPGCFTPTTGIAPFRTFINPYSPSIVAVNITDCPTSDGFRFEITDVLDVAPLMLKLFVCVLLELL